MVRQRSGLAREEVDLSVSAWTPNRKTPKTVLATEAYFNWGLLIAVRADNERIRMFGDLKGKIVGHYRDAAAERTVRALGAGTLVPYVAQEALFEDLKARKRTGVLFDSLYVRCVSLTTHPSGSQGSC